MSGHNKWSQIKHKKGAADKKRGLAFGKILKAISVAARGGSPESNPRLRSLIGKAREAGVPNGTIARAIERPDAESLEEMVIEAYGPGGAMAMISVITDSRNRTIAEIRRLLAENGGKFAEQGSVRWAFDGDRPKFPQSVKREDAPSMENFIRALEDHDDVERVITAPSPCLSPGCRCPGRY
jgi:transcriptional/translational regulatory protein YebC/TACO1